MKPISVKDKLPERNTYVLVRYTGGNWKDRDDQEGCVWTVAKFIRGISVKERDQLDDSDRRKYMILSGDQHANNTVPYKWSEFGPGSLFGQEVDYWMPLPVIK